jgi:tetratricopeptide (TPR) repeat protein
MPPKNHGPSDAKLLLAVAAVVVAGAVGIALVAGLTAQREATESERSVKSETKRRPARPVAVRSPSEDTAEPTVARRIVGLTIEDDLSASAVTGTGAVAPPATLFEIDPDADFWREGNRAFHRRAYDEAVAWFLADAEARPDRAYTHYMLGLTAWKAGQLDVAVEAMERSAGLNDRSIRTFINLSRIRNDRGEFDGALEAAERALLLDGENATSLYQKARSLYNLDRLEEAVTCLESCILLDAEAGQAHNLLGLIRLRGGDEVTALASFETAAELEPELAYVQNNLGLALEQSGRLAEAAVAFRHAVEVDSGHEAAELSLARVEALIPAGLRTETSTIELAEATGPETSDSESVEVETVDPAPTSGEPEISDSTDRDRAD